MSPTAELLQVGARFRVIQGDLSPIPFDSGNQRSIEIPRSFPYREFFLRLVGSVTVGVANSTNTADDYPLQLISRVDVLGDGRRQLASMTGQQFYRLCHLFSGKQPEISAPTLNVGTVAFSASFPITFEALRMVMPIDSLFDARSYEKVELRVTWATANALAQNGAPAGGTTFAIVATTALTVQTLQTTEGVEEIKFNRLHSTSELNNVATSQSLTEQVPRSGVLAGILLRTTRNDLKVDNIINFVTLRSDNAFDHVQRMSWAAGQRRNVKDFQLDVPGGTAASVMNGFLYIDLTEDGMISSALNTLDLNSLQLIFDTTFTSGTEKIQIGYLFFEPLVEV